MTLVTLQRGNWFVGPEICEPILRSLDFSLQKTGLICCGYVLMPDHLHCLLLQEQENAMVIKCVQDFKKFTSRNLRPATYVGTTLWRTRYDDVPVPGKDAALTKLAYMHDNPVKRDLVTHVTDWRWSSACAYLQDREDPLVSLVLIGL